MEPRTRTQVALAVAGVMLATVMQAVDGSIVNVALPRIQRELGGSLSHVGWAVTGYAIASLIAMPLAASLAARTGLRAYFAGSIAVFTRLRARAVALRTRAPRGPPLRAAREGGCTPRGGPARPAAPGARRHARRRAALRRRALREHFHGAAAARARAFLVRGGDRAGDRRPRQRGLILSARPLLGRFPARTVCAAGAAMFAASMVLHARLAFTGSGDAFLPQALRGAGTGLLYVGMNGFAFASVPEPELATSASLFYLLRQLGGAVGIALCASVMDAFGTRGTMAAFAALAVTAPVSLLPMAGADPLQLNREKTVR